MIRTRTRKQLNSSLVFLWLGVSAGLSAQAEAHNGDRVYPIAYLSDEMLEKIDLKDGLVEEWQELVGEPAMTLLDFTDSFGNMELDPLDLDFRIWLAWHDDPARFYVAFVASDDVYQNTHDYASTDFANTSILVQDSIALAIDGDHGGGPGCMDCMQEEEGAEALGQNQTDGGMAIQVGPVSKRRTP